MKAKIVVGLGFGDEGKGIVTDSLTLSSPNPIVIRFSGGQQAGHTVITDDTRHVFANFCSGALRGVPSYFTKHTCFYMDTIRNEKTVLQNKGANTRLIIHPLANMTTPFDVAYNRVREDKLKHGSCGLGIAATMKRNLESQYKLFAIDIIHAELFLAKYRNIENWYLQKVKDEGLDLSSFIKHVLSQQEDFLLTVDNWEDYIEIKDINYIYRNFETFIFEGSQGIMLDMDHGVFPNVTFSNTTSKNAIEVCNELGISQIETYYVTRCYQTRHGNGWYSQKEPVTLINNELETNISNQWQGNFKTCELDYELLKYAIQIDGLYNSSHGKTLVVTCMDQRPDFEFDAEKLNIFKDKIIFRSSNKN